MKEAGILTNGRELKINTIESRQHGRDGICWEMDNGVDLTFMFVIKLFVKLPKINLVYLEDIFGQNAKANFIPYPLGWFVGPPKKCSTLKSLC